MKNLKLYQKKLIENIRKQLSSWLTTPTTIHQTDLRRFFHSIIGTAPTIELDALGKIADEIHKQVQHQNQEEWDFKEVQELVSPILTVCYEYEYENDLDFPIHREDSVDTNVVFIIEDDVTLLMILKDYLEEKGYHVFAYRKSEKALSALYDIKPDCILLDIHLEDENGLHALEHITQMVQKHYVPIMMMSADPSESVRVTSYQKGADDFLLKPFKLHELEVRLNRQIQRKQFVDQLILVDELTKLYNRKYFAQVFSQYCTKQWGEGKADNIFSIAFLDLDHFKKINDQHGHLVGDEVLKGFSRFVNKRLESKDIFIRYGGEEFLIIFPQQNAHQVEKKLVYILNEFTSEIFTNEVKQPFSVSFSAGVVEIDSTLSISHSYWLDRADIALYTSKDLGRSRITVYNQQQLIPEKIISVAIIEDDIIMQLLLLNMLKQISSTIKKIVHIERYNSGEDFILSQWTKDKQEGIVLLNLNMEGISGIETLQKIDLSNFTVLMLSAESLEQHMETALIAGINDYVKKPFNIPMMKQKLKFYLDYHE